MARQQFNCTPLTGYQAEYGLMLAMMQDQTREWREELNEIDPDGIVWQAYPGGYSIGGVMLHIAECERYWIEEFCLGRAITEAEAKLFMSEDIQQYEGKWPNAPREPLAYYYKILDDVRQGTLQAMKEMPGPEVLKARGDHDFTMGWVLSHVLTHESYHGGQAVMLKELYLRSDGRPQNGK